MIRKIEELSNLIFLSSGLQNKEFWQEYKSELIKASELISGNVKIEDFIPSLRHWMLYLINKIFSLRINNCYILTDELHNRTHFTHPSALKLEK